jgi:hypothetical protein
MPGQFIVRKRQDNLASDAGEFANNPRLIEAWLAADPTDWFGLRMSMGGTAAELEAQHAQATALWQAMIDACC